MINTNNTVGDILRKARFNTYRFRFRKVHKLLARKKAEQKRTYDILKGKFASQYEAVKKYENANTTILAWRDENKKLKSVLLPYPPFSFLCDPVIMKEMVVTAGGKRLEHQIDFLKRIYSYTKLKTILEEDYLGEPLILNKKYLTSHNSVHQLFHIAEYLEMTSRNLNKIKTVVEWGGGYGCLAKIFRRLVPQPVTYILIDTPLICCLQWLYLAVIFGEKNVNLLLEPKSEIVTGKFNIVPVGLVGRLNLKANLFISTWGLSESSKQCQNDVVRKNWLGADGFLLAYRKTGKTFPYNGRLEGFAKKSGAFIQKVPYCTGSNYAFL